MKLCFGCMRRKEQSPVCEHCGYDESTANKPHQLPVGTQLQGKYLVGRVLGQGGFGITYLGWDQNLSTPVAIKEYYPANGVQRYTKLGSKVICISGESAQTLEKHRDRFLREARILAQLSNIPQIVQVRNFFPENDTAYIVMEYIPGITLKEYCRNLGRPMTVEEALAKMEPVLRALQKVHQQGLIHRDISPDNIMLPEAGGIKLIDFGAVRYVGSSEASKSTESVLKPGFAPIEQYHTRGNLGTWTDVYSICATIHYLLTGKVPPEAMERFDSDERLMLLRDTPGISGEIIAALEKGMKLNASERTQTVGELYEMLYAGKQEMPSEKTPVKKGLWLAVAGAVAAAALAAGLLLPKPGEALPQVQKTPETASLETSGPAAETKPEQTTLTEVEIRYNEADRLEAEGKIAEAAIAFGKLGNYRDALERSFALWDQVAVRKTVSIKYYSAAVVDDYESAAVQKGGTVVLAGYDAQGQDVSGWRDIIAVCVGGKHTVGLKADGTVVAAGSNEYGQCNVQDWTNIVAITADSKHTVGLRADGTVVAVGETTIPYYDYNRCDVGSWENIIAISVNEHQTLGLRVDGTVITTGSSNWDQDDIADWTDIVAISAANWNVLGLKADGTAVAAGINTWGQCNVSQWTDLVAISGGFRHTVGLKADGTLVTVGSNKDNFANYCGQCDVQDWTDIVYIDTGWYVTVGLRSDGTVVMTGFDDGVSTLLEKWGNILLPRF